MTNTIVVCLSLPNVRQPGRAFISGIGAFVATSIIILLDAAKTGAGPLA